MKIRTLFLTAFGPFTGARLDFSGPANLHLVYGANEAGKSSALRAIADLRYGIPARSKDDFIHPFKDLLLAGCFEDAAGALVGLARRKGLRDTLMAADPATGCPLDGKPALPIGTEEALTGGVARGQFETLYGLNTEQLRRGGQMLLQGDGALGAALFEASTGVASIRTLLKTLQDDARRYFVPRGQNPVLNEAARQLDEARQRYRLALVRPEQWKLLQRTHAEALARLQEIRQALKTQRDRMAELAELRAVAPLLQQLDAAQARWATLAALSVLPADARECRLAAEQALRQAGELMRDADAALAECAAGQAESTTEPLLLAQADAIDQLQADLAVVQRSRDSRSQLQATTRLDADQLVLEARRMALPVGADDAAADMAKANSAEDADADAVPGLAAFFARTPSAAAQAALALVLEDWQSLCFDQEKARQALGQALQQCRNLQGTEAAEPAPGLQQALATALRRAQALGDAAATGSALQHKRQQAQRDLDRAVQDLGLGSAAQLLHTRSPEPGALEHCERQCSASARQAAVLQDRLQQAQTALTAEQLRAEKLEAAGDIATAGTLRQARQLRDQRWQAVRSAFIDTPGVPAAAATPPADLPAGFEQAQLAADRQADLLREGAARAAEITECRQRSTEQAQLLHALQAEAKEAAAARQAQEQDWAQLLAGLGLPGGSLALQALGNAAAVRDWLACRSTALERQEQAASVQANQDRLAAQVQDASSSLAAALAALGHAGPAGLPADTALEAWIALGTGADRALVERRMQAQRQRADLHQAEQGIAALQAECDALQPRLDACRARLDAACGTLYLASGVPAPVVKARLAELQAWAARYQAHAVQLRQLAEMQAGQAAAQASASALAAQIGEPVVLLLQDWSGRLALRLARSRDGLVREQALAVRQADAHQRRQRAARQAQQATDTIAALVRQAGVADAAALPNAEAQADAHRAAHASVLGLGQQLAEASPRAVDALRLALAANDGSTVALQKQACTDAIAAGERAEKSAIETEQAAAAALARVDTSDGAALAREEMEAAIARYRAGIRPWAQLKLAEALLARALRLHREKSQGPVLRQAESYFRRMTGGRFTRLLVDADGDTPVLLAQPAAGRALAAAELSEGTADQLYLALRLAALQLQQQPGRAMPLVLDDVFMTADDDRAAHMFQALDQFAATTQVLVFTHHAHLQAIAAAAVPPERLRLHCLPSVVGPGIG